MTYAEYLLLRTFSAVESQYKSAAWQRDIKTGYGDARVSRPPWKPTKDERIGDDGARHRLLRDKLASGDYRVLLLRYSDNPTEIQKSWQHVRSTIRADTRLVKRLRQNPVLLRLLMLWHLRHGELRQKRNPLGLLSANSSETTQRRWSIDCQSVAEDWIHPAEDRAVIIMQEKGILR
ncbi:hypothetical protein [Candidatus Sororendozoicomonas aggregata]|uniref:hypothetical protein n=1 Tax=Candidatus Sororendozoicomonas aggregata TaxID=3073239 RepID=UPI002ED3CF9E